MPRKDANAAPANAQAQQEAASDGIENYELPKSLVTRIAKSAVRRENVSFAIERDMDGLYWVFLYHLSCFVCVRAGTDTRQCETAKRHCASIGERVDCFHKLLRYV